MIFSSLLHAAAQPEPRGPAAERTAEVHRALVALRVELEEASSSLDRLEAALTPTLSDADADAPSDRHPVDAAAACPPAHASDTPLTGA